MVVKHYTDISPEKVGGEARSTTIRWLIAEPEGAPNFYMRLFEVEPGGNTPHHEHEWEHEIFIIEGEGELVGDDESFPLNAGDAVFVQGGDIHHLENTGIESMKFLCLVPKHD